MTLGDLTFIFYHCNLCRPTPKNTMCPRMVLIFEIRGWFGARRALFFEPGPLPGHAGETRRAKIQGIYLLTFAEVCPAYLPRGPAGAGVTVVAKRGTKRGSPRPPARAMRRGIGEAGRPNANKGPVGPGLKLPLTKTPVKPPEIADCLGLKRYRKAHRKRCGV